MVVPRLVLLKTGKHAMRRFRWGVVGTGPVSIKFAAGLRLIGGDVAMVVSRGERGPAFAARFGGLVVDDPARAAAMAPGLIDAFYIATLPALHFEHAQAFLAAGVPVLIEKPIAASLYEAERLRDLARSKGVFAMEAMWTRFMPAIAALRKMIEAGAIGDLRMVSGSFGQAYRPDPGHGHFDAAQGGGALAHLGAYPLSLGQFLCGDAISAHATGCLGITGVDEDAAIALLYKNGVIGSFQISLRSTLRNSLGVTGTLGRIEIDGPIYRPWGLRVFSNIPIGRAQADPTRKTLFKEGALFQRLSLFRARRARSGRVLSLPYAGNGYHYEAKEVQTLVRAGALESAMMPLDHSVTLTALSQSLRHQIHRTAQS